MDIGCEFKDQQKPPYTDNVSILLMLDIALEAEDGCKAYPYHTMFQSFLCWILPWKTTTFGAFGLAGTRFNPSYAGYCPGSIGYNK